MNMVSSPHPYGPSHSDAPDTHALNELQAHVPLDGHHHHGHHHHGEALGAAFALATLLNVAFVIIESAFGFLSHSMVLLADAGHNFSDVLGLAAAWGASTLAQRGPTPRFTYGLRSSSILAALLNAIILLIAVGGITVEAAQRLVAPEPLSGTTIILVAAAGVVVNGIAAWLLSRGQRNDLNVRSAFVHMISDAVVSLGVIASGFAILLTGWLWLDSAASIAIAVVIVIGTWRLLRHSLDMALDAVPPGIDAEKVRRHLASLPGVVAVHDLHIWPMSTTNTALTCHLVMPTGHPGDAVLAQIADSLRERFGIDHATIQVETGDPEHPCLLVPDHVV